MLLQQLQYLRARLGLAVRDESGAVGTEYAILVAFGVLVIAAGVTLFGEALRDWFTDLATEIGLFNTEPSDPA